MILCMLSIKHVNSTAAACCVWIDMGGPEGCLRLMHRNTIGNDRSPFVDRVPHAQVHVT